MKGIRENNLTERQDILTCPVQEKSNGPGSKACLAEIVKSRSWRGIPGPVHNN